MKLKTILKYLFDRKSIKDPKPINRNTIHMFIQGHWRTLAKNFGGVQEYILEQASWREKQVKEKSYKCYFEGKCKYCECSLNESLISDAKCEHGCYPEMKNEKEWNKFKQQNNIKF